MKALQEFIVLAHRQTYATKRNKASSQRLSSKDYEFKKGGRLYHDTYFGDEQFLGSEVVYYKKKPLWGMNYYGYFTQKTGVPEGFGAFMGEALTKKNLRGMTIRGARSYKKGVWSYKIKTQGKLERFTALERIYCGKRCVYEAYLHGGLIK